jgi:hypothetical protein
MHAQAQGAPGLASKTQLTQQEKAGRWDDLIRTLRQPGLRNTYVRHLSAVRRAVILLLAEQEEQPAVRAFLEEFGMAKRQFPFPR